MIGRRQRSYHVDVSLFDKWKGSRKVFDGCWVAKEKLFDADRLDDVVYWI